MYLSRPALFLLLAIAAACGSTQDGASFADESALIANGISVTYDPQIDSLVFEMTVEGDAASVRPTPVGDVHGAPVLGYVFLTDLEPTTVGFDDVEGTVALAITSHPDFDDTPLWDEDGNAAYDDDGVIYHPHWVVLVEDTRAPAGLAVRQIAAGSRLPPTAPMPMYLDSPGFSVVEDEDAIRAIVPANRIHRELNFSAGGVVAYMEVDTSGDSPLLAVHEVISSVDGGALSTVTAGTESAPAASWPARSQIASNEAGASDAFDVDATSAAFLADYNSFVLSMAITGAAGTLEPTLAGDVNGAPVLGYVFPTTISPSAIGFADIDGTVALAVTSHPDFDDTPLWDEDMDANFENDGGFFHVHWAVLTPDDASPGGLSVPSQPDMSKLPPTAPMPMYLDSPGYHAFVRDGAVHVVVPAWHLRGVDAFNYDALTTAMRVDLSGAGPVLRVEEVFEVLSGDLSLPFSVERSEP